MREPGYEIRIKGRVSDTTLATFADLESELDHGETVLRAKSLDQAALHGVLERLRELGLELVEVRRMPNGSPS